MTNTKKALRRINPLINPVPDELFVNREHELDLFWRWAMAIPRRPYNSYALIGRRRTGKTAIIKKIYNKLFHEQDRILPVYISFDRYLERKEPISAYQFTKEYFGGYVASYLAFTYRQPQLMRSTLQLPRLEAFAKQVQDEYVLDLFVSYKMGLNEHIPHGLVQWVINFPWNEADLRRMPTAMIIDEFQVLTNVYDPKQNIHQDYTDSFQKAAEARWGPLLVSGSAISLLVDEALSGMVSGRFHYYYIEPLSRSHSHDLVFRWGKIENLEVNEELAEAIWQLSAGYPYVIQNLMTSYCSARQNYPDLSALEEVLIFELTNLRGKLWQHYNQEFRKYSELLNDGLVTKKVMYWATKYPEEDIDAERVAEEIGVEVKQVQKSLEKLHSADIVQRVGWTLYQGPMDPMLRRYIEYNHKREIEKLAPTEVVKDWKKEYLRLRGQANNEKGQFAEVHVGAVMRGFDGRSVDGAHYFNQAGEVTLPRFEKIEKRGGIVVDGIAIEIDLIGEYLLPVEEEEDYDDDEDVEEEEEEEEDYDEEEAVAPALGAWLVQVKYSKKRIREQTVRKFLTQIAAMKQQYPTTTCWFFAKGGFVKNAAKLLDEAGVLYSDRKQFNQLANLFDFFGLPE